MSLSVPAGLVVTADHDQQHRANDQTRIRRSPDPLTVSKETGISLPHHLTDISCRFEGKAHQRPWRLHTMDCSRLLQATYDGNGSQEDPYIVRWLSGDVENPKNLSLLRKCIITFLVAFMTLCVSLASSAYSGAAKEIVEEFDCSEEVFLLGLSLMVLGFAVGPVVFGPLSEALGRRHVLIACLVFYTLWTAVCAAAQNIQTLIVFRFICGLIGSACFTIPGGQIADMFEADQRGVAIAVYSAAPFLGPTLGPTVGGFLSPAAGWRWLMGFLALYAAALTFLGMLFVPETYAPVLLRRRANMLTKATGNVFKSQIDVNDPKTPSMIVKKSLILPWALLVKEPVVLLLSLYIAVVYGTLYLCFAAFPIVFGQNYGWNSGQTGLAFLGIMVGMLLGVAIIAWDNKRYVEIHRQSGGFAPPESRLPPAIYGGALLIVGLAWFAGTVSPTIPWPVPVLAGVPFGIGFLLIFMSCSNYLIDSYVIFAASVMAANSIIRSVFGAAFPLFTTYMYNNLGNHWAAAIPGVMALICFPFPVVFYIYGPKIRKTCKYSAQAAKILETLKLHSQVADTNDQVEAAGKRDEDVRDQK